jgi:hypothetical protein
VFPERLDRFLQAWLQNAGALLVCLWVGGSAVHQVERAGWISTRGWHTAWVTAVLFLSFLAWRDVRREEAKTQPEAAAPQRE